MAEITRTAKSGSDWSTNELLAYRITFKNIPPIEFFRPGPPGPHPSSSLEHLDSTPASVTPVSSPDNPDSGLLTALPGSSLDHLDPGLLTSPPGSTDRNLSHETLEYLAYLGLATHVATQTSMIDNFARKTLDLLGFSGLYLVPINGYAIPFTICGETHLMAPTNVCVIYRYNFVLLVLIQDTAPVGGTDAAEAQAVAGAVAAFQVNNRQRESLSLASLESMMIPCIILSGTCPTFYLVPVSQGLSNAVATGQCPPSQTEVLKCVTLLRNATGNRRHARHSMGDTEYRKLAFQHFLAFKTLARRHWGAILQGV